MEYNATLVRGNVYYLGGKRFDKGKAVAITEEEKKQLDGKDGSDKLHTKESEHLIPKFEFEERAVRTRTKTENKSAEPEESSQDDVSPDEEETHEGGAAEPAKEKAPKGRSRRSRS